MGEFIEEDLRKRTNTFSQIDLSFQRCSKLLVRYHLAGFYQEHKIHFTITLQGELASPAYEQEWNDLG